MAKSKNNCSRFGVRKSGPRVKSGPRKGQFYCYKSARRARSPPRRTKSPCSPHLSPESCAIDDRCTWKGKRRCIRKPRNEKQFYDYYYAKRSDNIGGDRRMISDEFIEMISKQ